jgi:hypothetical protein
MQKLVYNTGLLYHSMIFIYFLIKIDYFKKVDHYEDWVCSRINKRSKSGHAN